VSAETDDLLAQQLRALRREYLADSTQRVDELRRLYVRLAAGDRAALPELRQGFHRLAGSGGSYGFPSVSTRSREGEGLASRLAAVDAPIAPVDLESLRASVEGIALAFAEALSALDGEAPG
jgi:hypothetical protein